MAVVAPTPSASVRIAATAKPGERRSVRTAYRTSRATLAHPIGCSCTSDLLNGLERFQPILANLDGHSRSVTNDDAHCVLGGRAQHLRCKRPPALHLLRCFRTLTCRAPADSTTIRNALKACIDGRPIERVCIRSP